MLVPSASVFQKVKIHVNHLHQIGNVAGGDGRELVPPPYIEANPQPPTYGDSPAQGGGYLSAPEYATFGAAASWKVW